MPRKSRPLFEVDYYSTIWKPIYKMIQIIQDYNSIYTDTITHVIKILINYWFEAEKNHKQEIKKNTLDSITKNIIPTRCQLEKILEGEQ